MEQLARTINQLKGKVTMLFIAHQIRQLKFDILAAVPVNEARA